MSTALLKRLNGGRNGALRRWIENQSISPRIAWYPSAGQDFRDLLYLDRRYVTRYPVPFREPAPPDIFIHTDYFTDATSGCLDLGQVHEDAHTRITVRAIEALPDLRLPLDSDLVHFPDQASANGPAVFMELEVTSDQLGTFYAPLIYLFVENVAFFTHLAIPAGARFSHVIHVRHGGGLGGGGSCSGAWLLDTLAVTECEAFITDGHLHDRPGDRIARRALRAAAGEAVHSDPVKLQAYRFLQGTAWSNHGDLTWNIPLPSSSYLPRLC